MRGTPQECIYFSAILPGCLLSCGTQQERGLFELASDSGLFSQKAQRCRWKLMRKDGVPEFTGNRLTATIQMLPEWVGQPVERPTRRDAPAGTYTAERTRNTVTAESESRESFLKPIVGELVELQIGEVAECGIREYRQRHV